MRQIKYIFIYKHSAHWNVSFGRVNLLVDNIFHLYCLIFLTYTRYSFFRKVPQMAGLKAGNQIYISVPVWLMIGAQ